MTMSASKATRHAAALRRQVRAKQNYATATAALKRATLEAEVAMAMLTAATQQVELYADPKPAATPPPGPTAEQVIAEYAAAQVAKIRVPDAVDLVVARMQEIGALDYGPDTKSTTSFMTTWPAESPEKLAREIAGIEAEAARRNAVLAEQGVTGAVWERCYDGPLPEDGTYGSYLRVVILKECIPTQITAETPVDPARAPAAAALGQTWVAKVTGEPAADDDEPRADSSMREYDAAREMDYGTLDDDYFTKDNAGTPLKSEAEILAEAERRNVRLLGAGINRVRWVARVTGDDTICLDLKVAE